MYYATENQVEEAMKVVAAWLSKNRNIKIVYHNSTAVDADIFAGVIRIPRMACASGITQEALNLLRHAIYHEGGHIAETRLDKSEYPKGAKFEIFNALEDRRMERRVATDHEGCGPVFRWATEYYNKRIAGQIIAGQGQPLWEALCAMAMMVEGTRPLWKLTPKADVYFKAAYNEFSQIRFAKSAKDSLEIAKKVYELLKEENKKFNEENKPQPKSQPKQDKEQKPEEKESDENQSGGSGENEEQESGEEDSDENQSSGSGDLDDETEEKETESKSGSDEEDSEDKADKDDEKDSDSKDESENEESEGKESKADEPDADDSDKKESENSADGSDDKDDDEEESENGDADDDDSGDAGDEQESKGEEKGGGKGESEKAEDKADKDEQKNEDEESPAEEDKEADELAEKQADTKLEDETDGLSKKDALDEELKKEFEKLTPEDLSYLANRDGDIHNVPPVSDYDRPGFEAERAQISVNVASLTRAFEQALRAITRCRKEPYQRHGKIDKKRFVAIAKSLSKEVFSRQKDGEEISTAVEIVIDESGSMNGEIHDVRLLAIAIGESLSKVGVPFEITGTTTQFGQDDSRIPPMDGMNRTNPIVYNHYKAFDEHWDVVKSRLMQMRAKKHNVDGEVVEYAAMRLAGRNESRRVVFSLSDGEPCAGQYNDDVMGANLKRVCERCRKNGIEVYGIGLETNEPAQFYGEKYFLYLNDVSEMGGEFVKKIVSVITAGRISV